MENQRTTKQKQLQETNNNLADMEQSRKAEYKRLQILWLHL